jgi:hypothetical protein
MRIILTNLSNDLYKSSRLKLNESARAFGIAEVRSYDFEALKGTAFYKDNEKILSQPRGIGYWLWKPYIILEAMKDLSEGDIVVYSDCGIEVIDKLDPLIKICSEEQPVVLFANGDLLNAYWTKRDCFLLMDCDDRSYWYSAQCDAAFALFRKSALTIQFLEQWLAFSSNEHILTDIPNTGGKSNLPGFIQHRWDQSVLSLLAHKFQLPLFRMPTQFGNHYKAPAFRVEGEFNCVNQVKLKQLTHYAKAPFYNSPYFQLLNHHRSKSGKEQKAKSSFSITRSLKKNWNKVAGILSQWYYTTLVR